MRPGSRDLGGIRQTTVGWPGPPPTSGAERWKRHAISDWRIFRKARRASALDGHRQYEAALDLEESGLHPGVPFAAYVEVETDPDRDAAGKFRGRRYLGRLGGQLSPVWFVIGRGG